MRKAKKAMGLGLLIMAVSFASVAWGQVDPTTLQIEDSSHPAKEALVISFTGSNQMIDAPPELEITVTSVTIEEAATEVIKNKVSQIATIQESNQNNPARSQMVTSTSAVVTRQTVDLKEGSLASAKYSRPANIQEIAMINKYDSHYIDKTGALKGLVSRAD